MILFYPTACALEPEHLSASTSSDQRRQLSFASEPNLVSFCWFKQHQGLGGEPLLGLDFTGFLTLPSWNSLLPPLNPDSPFPTSSSCPAPPFFFFFFNSDLRCWVWNTPWDKMAFRAKAFNRWKLKALPVPHDLACTTSLSHHEYSSNTCLPVKFVAQASRFSDKTVIYDLGHPMFHLTCRGPWLVQEIDLPGSSDSTITKEASEHHRLGPQPSASGPQPSAALWGRWFFTRPTISWPPSKMWNKDTLPRPVSYMSSQSVSPQAGNSPRFKNEVLMTCWAGRILCSWMATCLWLRGTLSVGIMWKCV